jgi:hypothetical protein
MNVLRLRWAVLGGGLLAALLLAPRPVLADDAAAAADPDAPTAATVLAIDGVAQVDENGTWRDLEESEPLDAGDRVRTSDGASLHLVLADGSSLVLGPNSEATLQSLGSGGEGSQTFIALASGLINAMVEHLKPDSRFEIQTPSATAAVKGTDFEVSNGDPDHGTGVTVNEGTVQLGDSSGANSAPVHPGEQRFFVHGGLGEARRLSDAEAASFHQRWARAHERHLQRFQLLRHVRQIHRNDRQRFLRRFHARGNWRRAHPGRFAGRPRARALARHRAEHRNMRQHRDRPNERKREQH